MVDEPGSVLPRALDEAVERLLVGSLRAPRLEAGARARMLARLAQAASPRPRRWLRWALVPALAAVGVLVLVLLWPPSRGVVISADPGLERLRRGRTEAATAGMALHAGDLVRTASGRAVVSLDRGSLVALEPHSSLEVAAAPSAVRLATGRARFQIAANGRFQVGTAGGTITVTGTLFEVTVLGRAPSYRVFVHLNEGSVRLESPAGQLVLGAGESAVLVPEAAPRRLEGMRAAEKVVVARAALTDCTRAGGADCDEIARAVKTLQAMEEPVSDAERGALTEATGRAQARYRGALRRLHAEIVGVEAPATAAYGALVEEIEATLSPEELREARSRLRDGSAKTSAGRFVTLVGDTNEAIREELARLVPLHRVAPILSSRARKNEGGRP